MRVPSAVVQNQKMLFTGAINAVSTFVNTVNPESPLILCFTIARIAAVQAIS